MPTMSLPNNRKTLLLATAPGRHVPIADSYLTG
jgi:hypothetical protein